MGGQGLLEGPATALGGEDVGHVARDGPDVGDPSVALRDDVLGRLPHRVGVVDPDARVVRHRRSDGDRGQGKAIEESKFLVRHGEVEGDDAVDPAPQQVLAQVKPRVVTLVLEVEEQDMVATRTQGLLDGGHQ